MGLQHFSTTAIGRFSRVGVKFYPSHSFQPYHNSNTPQFFQFSLRRIVESYPVFQFSFSSPQIYNKSFELKRQQDAFSLFYSYGHQNLSEWISNEMNLNRVVAAQCVETEPGWRTVIVLKEGTRQDIVL